MLLKTIILPDFLSSAGVSVHVSRKKKKILLIITRVIINTVIMRRRYVAYIPIESKKHVKYCGVSYNVTSIIITVVVYRTTSTKDVPTIHGHMVPWKRLKKFERVKITCSDRRSLLL